jgi:hypothetical protein
MTPSAKEPTSAAWSPLGATGTRTQKSSTAPELVARVRGVDPDIAVGVELGVSNGDQARSSTMAHIRSIPTVTESPRSSASTKARTRANLTSIPSPSIEAFHLGPLTIHIYALCILAGIVVAYISGGRRYQARGGKSIADSLAFRPPYSGR